MACRGFWECLLKLLNFLLAVAGLAIVGYGIYLFVEYKHATDDLPMPPSNDHDSLIQLGRPMLMAVSLTESIFDKLPKPWFIYLFVGVGVILFVVSFFGCIGAMTRNGCCLSCELPVDKTGNFDMIYGFLNENWEIIKWVALGIVVFEALIFLLALPPPPATGVPVAGTLDQRPSRNDAWSTRMREKYGLDTAEFTYNPSESQRYQQVAPQPTEERSRCTIM
ncbi:Tobamovirus multiplication protein 2A [Linum perenne]